MPSLGQKLQEIASRNNISQEKLAKMLGRTQKTISNWMGDRIVPKDFFLQKISEIFGVDINILKDEKLNLPPLETDFESFLGEIKTSKNLADRLGGGNERTTQAVFELLMHVSAELHKNKREMEKLKLTVKTTLELLYEVRDALGYQKKH